MIGVLLHQHIGEQRFARQPAWDDMLRCPRLRHAVAARPAAHLRTHRHQHAILCWHNVEAFGAILADPVQFTAAVRAGTSARRDLDLMTRQVSRQRRARCIGCALPRRRSAGRLERFDALLLDHLNLAHGDAGILERQQQLVRHHLLRAPAKVHAVENVEQMLESGGAKTLGDDHRLQRSDVVGQVFSSPLHDAD